MGERNYRASIKKYGIKQERSLSGVSLAHVRAECQRRKMAEMKRTGGKGEEIESVSFGPLIVT